MTTTGDGPAADAAAVKTRAALGSVVASAGLAAAKFAAALFTGSLALLSEAIHSLIDVGSTVMTFFAVRIADRPADEDHHYGHTKVESIAALIETMLLFVASAWIVSEGIDRLRSGDHAAEFHWIAVAVLVAAIGIDWVRARGLARLAEEHRSQALESGALHFAADMASSLVVLAGLGLVYLGYGAADAIAAIVVAVMIAVAALRLAKRTIDTLTDAAPAGLADDVRRALDGVPGVVAVERVRVRPAGSVYFADVEIAVGRTRPAEEIVDIKRRAVEAVKASVAHVEVNLAAQPVVVDDDTALASVLHVARARGALVHHVTVQDVRGRRVVTFDLEVDGRATLEEAHRAATDLEDAIALELGGPIEVDAHIEPLQSHRLAGIDAEPAEVDRIRARLEALAANGRIREIHAVRVRWTEDGPVVFFHGRLPADLAVGEAHAEIDRLERALRQAEPGVARAVGHAEPIGFRHAPEGQRPGRGLATPPPRSGRSVTNP